MIRRILKFGRTLLTLGALGAVVALGVSFVPTLMGYESLIVTSGSMGRAMPVGSVATTRMVDARAIAAGDIVSFRTDESEPPTTHRVIRIADEDGRRVLATKGDANPAEDPRPLVLAGDIHRVEWVVPYAGYIVWFARSPAGGALLFLLPMAGLTVELGRKRRVRRSRRRPAWETLDLPDAGYSISTMELAARRLKPPPPLFPPMLWERRSGGDPPAATG